LSLVDDVRKQVEGRIRELKPLVDEYQQLEKLAGGWIEEAKAIATGRGRGGARRARRASSARAASASRSTGTATKTRKAPAKRRAAPKRATARKTTATRAASTGARRGGRRRGSGTRAAQALALVKSKPGITIPEIASQMGIKQNYLYRVLPGLESDGKVKRRGRGWTPA
jgi:hypothetical protein